MKKAVIKQIESVDAEECRVSLYGMRADLENNIRIVLSDIPEWGGIGENGVSLRYELKEGATIYYDRIFVATRRMEHPRFTE